MTCGVIAWKAHMWTPALPVRMVRNDFITPVGEKGEDHEDD